MGLHHHLFDAARRHLGRAVLVTGALGALVVGTLPNSALAADINPRTTTTTRTTTPAAAPWSFRSVDTMHVTRDYMCYQQTAGFMASIAHSSRSLHTNFSTITTPYDAPANYHQCTPKDPIAYETAWVRALRGEGLHVWFRQTWFNWEGSYGAPKLTADTTPAIRLGSAAAVLNGSDTTSYMARTYRFILAHRGLYANGDMFTPEPEPVNGGIRIGYGCSGPCQFPDWATFNSWLRDSMTVDSAAFRQLGLQVSVGNWGLPCANHKYIEDSTIAQMGTYNTDCYFRDTTELVSRLTWAHNTYHVDIVVGEWGDIWDGGLQPTTTREVSATLAALARLPFVRGLNYFQIFSGDQGEGLVDHNTLLLNSTGREMMNHF
jgi:hypothetical protein